MGPRKRPQTSGICGCDHTTQLARQRQATLGPYARVRSRLYTNRSMPSSMARITCPAKGSPITHGRFCGEGEIVGRQEGSWHPRVAATQPTSKSR